jgi:hypothetical protein
MSTVGTREPTEAGRCIYSTPADSNTRRWVAVGILLFFFSGEQMLQISLEASSSIYIFAGWNYLKT